MEANKNNRKYKMLLGIFLGECVLTEMLSALGVNFSNKVINLVSFIIILIPVMLLLDTVSKDARFNSHIRSIAKFAIWAVGVCAVGGFIADCILR